MLSSTQIDISLFSPEFHAEMISHVLDCGLVVHTRWFDPKIGRCFGLWLDPLYMYTAGLEVIDK